jgi:hypothetical protein
MKAPLALAVTSMRGTFPCDAWSDQHIPSKHAIAPRHAIGALQRNGAKSRHSGDGPPLISSSPIGPPDRAVIAPANSSFTMDY